MAGKNTVNVSVKVTDKGLQETTRKVDKLGKAVKGSGKQAKKAKTEIEGYHNAQGVANSSTRSGTKNFAKQSQGLGGLVKAYATTAANIWAITAAFSALQRAMDVKILEDSMATLDRAKGTNLVGMAKALKEAAGGMIGFEEAAQKATTVMAAGFGQTELVGLGKAARAASQALGRDFGDSLDRMIRGVIKAEPELLDELGIILRLNDASKTYADTMGKSVSELSTYEKQVAVMNEVLAQSETKYGALIASQDKVNQFTRLQATATEVLNKSLGAMAEYLSPLAKYFSDNKTALQALMAVFGLFIFKMAIPGLSSLGSKLAATSSKFDDMAEKFYGRASQLNRSSIDMQKTMSLKSGKASETITAQIKELDKNGKLTASMKAKLGTSLKNGALLTPAQAKSVGKNITQSYNEAFKNVDPNGIVSKGVFEGTSRKVLERQYVAHRQAMNTLNNQTTTAVTRMRNGFVSSITIIRGQFAQLRSDIYSTLASGTVGFSAMGAAISSSGLLSGLKLFVSGLGKATAEMTTMGTVAYATGGAIKFLGSALMSAMNAAFMLYAAFQAYKFISEYFKSDEVKAYEKALKEVKEGYDDVKVSAEGFSSTLYKLQKLTVSSSLESVQSTELLVNSYIQASDAITTQISKIGALIRAKQKDAAATTAAARATLEATKAASKARADAAAANTTSATGQRGGTVGVVNPLLQAANTLEDGGPIGIQEKNLAAAEAAEAAIVVSDAALALLDTTEQFSGIWNSFKLSVKGTEGELGVHFLEKDTANITVSQIEQVSKAFTNFMSVVKAENQAVKNSMTQLLAVGPDAASKLIKSIIPSGNSTDTLLNSVSDVIDAADMGREAMQQMLLVRPEDVKKGSVIQQINELRNMMASINGDPIPIPLEDKDVVSTAHALVYLSEEISQSGDILEDVRAKFREPLVLKISSAAAKNALTSNLAILKESLRLAKNSKDSTEKTRLVGEGTAAVANEEIRISDTGFDKQIAAKKAELSRSVNDMEKRRLEDDIVNLKRAKIVEQDKIIQLRMSGVLTAADQAALATSREELNTVASLEDQYTSLLRTKEDLAWLTEQELRLLKETGAAANRAYNSMKQRYQSEALALEIAHGKYTGAEKQRAALEKVKLANAQRTLDLTRQIYQAELALSALKIKESELIKLGSNRSSSQDLELADVQNQIVDATASKSLLEKTDPNIESQKGIDDAILQNPQTITEGWNSALSELAQKSQSVGAVIQESLGSAFEGLANSIAESTWQFGEMLISGEMNTKKLGEAFGNMAADIVKDITKMIMKQIILNALTGGLGMLAGGSGPSFAPRTASPGGLGGGIPKFAEGGVVNKPTVALFGEAGAEAFVPLPDGKTIPVTMDNSSVGGMVNNTNVTVNVASDGTSTMKDTGAKDLGKAISSAVQQELIKQSRPGGLLNR